MIFFASKKWHMFDNFCLPRHRLPTTYLDSRYILDDLLGSVKFLLISPTLHFFTQNSQSFLQLTIFLKAKNIIINLRYMTLFSYKPGSMPSFLRHTLRSRIQNADLFWGSQKFLRASEVGKKKQPQLHHFLEKR